MNRKRNKRRETFKIKFLAEGTERTLSKWCGILVECQKKEYE